MKKRLKVKIYGREFSILIIKSYIAPNDIKAGNTGFSVKKMHEQAFVFFRIIYRQSAKIITKTCPDEPIMVTIFIVQYLMSLKNYNINFKTCSH